MFIASLIGFIVSMQKNSCCLQSAFILCRWQNDRAQSSWSEGSDFKHCDPGWVWQKPELDEKKLLHMWCMTLSMVLAHKRPLGMNWEEYSCFPPSQVSGWPWLASAKVWSHKIPINQSMQPKSFFTTILLHITCSEYVHLSKLYKIFTNSVLHDRFQMMIKQINW